MSLPPLTRRAFGAVSALSAAAVWAPAIGVRAQTDGAALGRVTVAVGGQGVLYHLPLALADAFQTSLGAVGTNPAKAIPSVATVVTMT